MQYECLQFDDLEALLMIVLGIETSCDETAAAIVTDDKRILSNVLRSQGHHEEYGGVVPEIAARAHLQLLQPLVEMALEQANITTDQLDGIAVTGGPGLIGGVIVGVMFAKGMAAALNVPFLGINHLAGHALTVRLTNDVEFPYLLLLTSGGHCQLLIVKSAMDYKLLGTTIDDAAGEAFDKVGKMLDLAYPAGPKIETLALAGNPKRFAFPRPLLHDKEQPMNFSFSGLKTAVRRQIDQLGTLTTQDTQDVCASFQQAVLDIFASKVTHALDYCEDHHIKITHLVTAGGVAANHMIRETLNTCAVKKGVPFIAPPGKLCTDNAAMIAWAGVEKLVLGLSDALDFAPRPRWPLEE
jgi:N6-L-threonylcarbamoyladenine synthase